MIFNVLTPLRLVVDRRERELLQTIGTVVEREAGEVDFTFHAGVAFNDLFNEMEKRIQFQESDQGCWATALEWREARPTLIDKMRKALLQPVRFP